MQTGNADIQAKIADLIKRKRAFEEKRRKELEQGKGKSMKTKKGRQKERDKAKKEKKLKKAPWLCFVCRLRIKKRKQQIRHLWFVHIHPDLRPSGQTKCDICAENVCETFLKVHMM